MFFKEKGGPMQRHLKRVLTAGIATLSALGLMGFTAQAVQTEQSADIVKEDCFIPGIRVRVTCATMAVPLYRENPAAGEIEIFAAVLGAKSGKPEADPLVLFAGGPGQAASELTYVVAGVLGDIWQDRDVLLIDQRGTGRSTPLDCDFAEDAFSPEQQREEAAKCLQDITVDTRAFNLEESVHDIAAMIKALGYSSVNTYGVSYGTRTSAHFYRRYPELVRSIIVDAVAPPDYSLLEVAPKAAEDALNALIVDCEISDPCNTRFPTLRRNVADYLNAAKEGSLRYTGQNPLTGEPIDVAIDEIGAVESLRGVLYGANDTIILPYAIERAAQGDLSVVMNQGFAEQTRGGMYLGMTLSYLCGEDIDRTSPEEAARFGEGSFARDTFYRNFKNMCDVWQYTRFAELPDDMFTPWAGEVPTLILSGDLDPITPKEGGEHIMKKLTNARHIIVPGTGHGTFSVACVPYMMKEFLDTLDTGSLDPSCTDRIKRAPIVVGPNGQTLLR